MKLFQKLIASLLFLALLTFTLPGCERGTGEPEDPCPNGDCSTPVNLVVWRLFEDREVMNPIIDAYVYKYPNVTIEYKKMDFDGYEETLINALSAGRGPDIFQIHNDWLPKHWDKISPVPDEIMSLQEYQDFFVPVAADDFIFQNRIYAIPLSVDTLALYYNRDIFIEHNLFSPPTTWQQLVELSRQFTNTTPAGNILDSGITLGTANNVNRASDILYAMMLQNGVNFTSPDNTSASFALPIVSATGDNFYPGQNALEFYTTFSTPSHPNYCWNHQMLGSLDAFNKGQAAMTINYSYQKPVIDRYKLPDMRYSVTGLPKIVFSDDPISYANYWGETVNKQSKNAAWSWHFLRYASENTSKYLERANKPTAVRADAKISYDPIDQQSLYAQSVYKIRADEVDTIINEMIDQVAIEGLDIVDALNKAQNDITDIMQKNRIEL